MTPRGFGVLAGTTEAGQVVLVRKPGGGFRKPRRFPTKARTAAERRPAPVRQPEPSTDDRSAGRGGRRSGRARGARTAKPGRSVEKEVLHWDGSDWSAEPIEIPAASSEDFRVLAIGASLTGNAWLLAQLSANFPAGAVALFRRVEEAEPNAELEAGRG